MKTANFTKTRLARDKIIEWIREGKISEGEKLPSERTLAKVFGMNHQTVRKSLAELENEGLIVRKHRIGSFIKEVPPVELTKGIALVVPEYMTESTQIPQHPLLNLYVRSLLANIDQRKYSISILSYKPNRLWIDVGEILTVRKIKGIVLHPVLDVSVEDIRKILDNGIKVVLLHQEPHLIPLNLPYICIDEQIPMAQIIEKFVKLGHRDIAICTYEQKPFNYEKKVFLEIICQRFGLNLQEKLMIRIPNKAGKMDFSVLDAIFNRRPMPTAVLVHDEFCAAYIFRKCYELGIRIPEDMSIAAVMDNTPNFHPVALSAPDTTMLNVEAMRQSIRILEKLIANDQVNEKEIRLKSEMRWTNSVGQCKKQNVSINKVL